MHSAILRILTTCTVYCLPPLGKEARGRLEKESGANGSCIGRQTSAHMVALMWNQAGTHRWNGRKEKRAVARGCCVYLFQIVKNVPLHPKLFFVLRV